MRKLTENVRVRVRVAQLSSPALINPDLLVLIPWPGGISHYGDGSATGGRNQH